MWEDVYVLAMIRSNIAIKLRKKRDSRACEFFIIFSTKNGGVEIGARWPRGSTEGYRIRVVTSERSMDESRR